MCSVPMIPHTEQDYTNITFILISKFFLFLLQIADGRRVGEKMLTNTVVMETTENSQQLVCVVLYSFYSMISFL